jgi:hypothetical protein
LPGPTGGDDRQPLLQAPAIGNIADNPNPLRHADDSDG